MKKKDGNNSKQSYILTKETLGMTILLFCGLVFIILLTGKLVFGALGSAICTFMYGTFGYASYIVIALLAYLGEILVFEKKLSFNKRVAAAIGLTAAMLFLLFHAVSTRGYALGSFGSYLSDCYFNASKGYAGYTFGGALSAIIVYPIAKGAGFIGAYIIFALLSALCGYLTFLTIRKGRGIKSADADVKQEGEDDQIIPPAEEVPHNDGVDHLYTVNDNYEIVKNKQQPAQQQKVVQPQPQYQQPQRVAQQPVNKESDEDKFSSQKLGKKILFENGEFAAESYRRNMIFSESSYFNHPVQNDSDYLNSFSSGKKQTPAPEQTYSSSYSEEIEKKAEGEEKPAYIYGDKPVDNLDDFDDEEEVYGGEEIESQPEIEENISPLNSQPVREDPKTDDVFNVRSERDAYNLNQPVDQPVNQPEERNARDVLFGNRADSRTYGESIRRNTDEEKPADSGSIFGSLFSSSNSRLNTNRIEPDSSRLNLNRSETDRIEPRNEQPVDDGELFNSRSSRSESVNNDDFLGSRRQERSNANIFDEEEEESVFDDGDTLGARGLRSGAVDSGRSESVIPDSGRSPRDNSLLGDTGRTSRDESIISNTRDSVPPAREHTPINIPKKPEPVAEVAPEPEKPKHVWKKYVRPSLDLLDDYPENANINTAEIEDNKSIIVETLANFRIASQIANVVVGPAITRYDVIIEDKTNIKNALKYKEAIAMALMKENVTAYLNYSKGAISIEVPNSSRSVVGLKSMLASSKFINCKPNTLTFALGKNVEGQVVCPDITKMPHLLVAGTTGSGKSICLSSLIVSLLYKYGPEELRFILVDPKQVEFISYDKLPHLMINEIIYDVDKAIKALNWAIKEMERRYQLFKEMTEQGIATKNLTEYNQHLPEGEEKLPKIVIILDEFGDLMLQAKKEIESRIIRLVQKARACGIHLILATQRPSVDCITGLIKSNLPTRVGFKVNSFDDARTIFDIGGAEKLLGKGDMYFRSAESPDLARIQGCFIDTHEVQKVTDFIKQNNETYFDQSVSDFINTVEEVETESGGGESVGDDGETKIDDTFIKALKFCVTSNQASVSMIQRRFPVGYIKACKIIDWMENMNYVTQSEGSKPRKVLLSKEEFIRTYGEVDD